MNDIIRPLVKIGKTGLRFVSKNSNLILTIVSATGVIVTTIFAIKGTIKAVKLCEEVKPVGAKEVIKTVWKCYIPTIGIVILTTTAILCNGHINAKRLALVTSAYTSSVEALKRVESKMTDVVGPKKAAAVIDEAHSESARNNLPSSPSDIIQTGSGGEIFFVDDVGQWLYSDTHRIELAEMKTAKSLRNSDDWDEKGDNFIIMNVALEHLGARPCAYGRTHGWKESDLKELGLEGPKFRISSARMDINGENRAVGTIWFEPEPMLL